MRLNAAESATAALGPSARVLIDVATALAVSWNPFVKIESQRDQDRDDQQNAGAHQAFLRVMPSITLATSSQRSSESSSNA